MLTLTPSLARRAVVTTWCAARSLELASLSSNSVLIPASLSAQLSHLLHRVRQRALLDAASVPGLRDVAPRPVRSLPLILSPLQTHSR